MRGNLQKELKDQTMEEPVKNNITPNGKEIDIIADNNHIKVQFKTGGELPQILSGLFTSRVEAQKAINIYLGSR